MNGVTMGCPLGHSSANAFLAYHKQHWLYIDVLCYVDLFIINVMLMMYLYFLTHLIFEHLKQFESYSNSYHINMSFLN